MEEKIRRVECCERIKRKGASYIGWTNIFEYIPFTKHGEYNG